MSDYYQASVCFDVRTYRQFHLKSHLKWTLFNWFSFSTSLTIRPFMATINQVTFHQVKFQFINTLMLFFGIIYWMAKSSRPRLLDSRGLATVIALFIY